MIENEARMGVVRELTRPNRFERRVLAEDFLDAHTLAHEDTVHPFYRRVSMPLDPERAGQPTWCILFLERSAPRELRRQMLQSLCLVARSRRPEYAKVIATEKEFEESCSYDFVVLDLPELTAEQQDLAAKLQSEHGILKSAPLTRTSLKEYPDVEV